MESEEHTFIVSKASGALEGPMAPPASCGYYEAVFGLGYQPHPSPHSEAAYERYQEMLEKLKDP